jgi:hypothetical protein
MYSERQTHLGIQTSAERYYEWNNNQENDPAFDLFSKLSVLIRIHRILSIAVYRKKCYCIFLILGKMIY